MNKYLVESKIGWLEVKRRTLVESESLSSALEFEMKSIKLSYPVDEIVDIHITKKFQPCPYCFTEQMECYGCPNIVCPSKSMIIQVD